LAAPSIKVTHRKKLSLEVKSNVKELARYPTLKERFDQVLLETIAE
jgi:hypothetical protein